MQVISEYANIQYFSCKYASMQVYKYASMQIYECTMHQVWIYATMQLCKFAGMQISGIEVCKYVNMVFKSKTRPSG